jgi:hypothetical protein
MVTPTEAQLEAHVHAMKVLAALEKQDEQVWLYFYDGDSGECLGTCIHLPE